MLAQFVTDSWEVPVRLTPLTVRTDTEGLAKSRTELDVTLRLPKVSVVPLSLSVPPARTMLRLASLKLAPSVRVVPLERVSVPEPVKAPLRRSDPEVSVSAPPLPNATVPAPFSVPIAWLVLNRSRVVPVVKVIAVVFLNAFATVVWSVPPLIVTEPEKDGLATPMAS